jgi:hypothetical protein
MSNESETSRKFVVPELPAADRDFAAPAFATQKEIDERGTVMKTEYLLAENPLSSSFEERAGVGSGHTHG